MPSIGDSTGCPPGAKLTCWLPRVSTSRRRPATAPSPAPVCRATSLSEKYAAAITAVIMMKNCTMSMTSTPQSPECAANTTLRMPQTTMVCHGGSPKRMLPILHAASVTIAMMKQLKNRPR